MIENQTSAALTFQDVKAAASIVRRHATRTPILTSQLLNERLGHQVFLKAEHLQKVGAFKFRGAIHAVSRLDESQQAAGVITHSSGNHGAALALAASSFGIEATVVVPQNAPEVKKRAVESYGAQVVLCEPTLESRVSTVEKIRSRTGAVLIPPFDHPDIIAGQGTAALELVEQVPDLDVVVAPIGGGGLMAGTCLVAKQNSITVIGAEPCHVDDAVRSKNAGKKVTDGNRDTIADGLKTYLGDLTWPFVRDVVQQVVTVSEQEIVDMMKFVWLRTKQMIEPSAAVSIAAVAKPEFPLPTNSRVGVIVSGGNVDIDHLPW